MQDQVVLSIDIPKYSMLSYLSTNLGLDLSDKISIPRVIKRRIQYSPDAIALKEKRHGIWLEITYKQLEEFIYTYSAQLMHKGFQPNDKAAILLPNGKKWAVSDLGNLFAHAITVPIYQTLNSDSIMHILKNSQSRMIVVETGAQAMMIQAMGPKLPSLQYVVVLEEPKKWHKPAEAASKQSSNILILSWKQWMEEGAIFLKQNQDKVRKAHLEIVREDLATIIYTSGTTGLPKGVMLTHKNILANLYGISLITNFDHNDELLSILPLSHIFERVIGHFCPLMMGATISYAESVDTIGENLTEIRPTICAAVPRIFEKIYAGILSQVAEGSWLKQKIFHWARKIGDQNTRLKKPDLIGEQPQRSRHRPEEFFSPPEFEPTNLWSRFQYWLANMLVFRKINKKFGSRIRYFLTGGAALDANIISFFRSINIWIYEGYGLTETAPIVAFNHGINYEEGTVGKLLPFVEVKFGEDDEILVKGPNVMAGYYLLPKENKEAINPDGWFHTGDLGMVTPRNFLKITGRKKDIIVTSNGKNVPSTPIESALSSHDIIAHSLIVGNNKKYIAALIFPDFESVRHLAQEHRIDTGKGIEELCAEETIVSVYQNIVTAVNEKLSRYEQIKKFQLIPQELTIENGQLTPTLKAKRNVIEKNNYSKIEQLYQSQ